MGLSRIWNFNFIHLSSRDLTTGLSKTYQIQSTAVHKDQESDKRDHIKSVSYLHWRLKNWLLLDCTEWFRTKIYFWSATLWTMWHRSAYCPQSHNGKAAVSFYAPHTVSWTNSQKACSLFELSKVLNYGPFIQALPCTVDLSVLMLPCISCIFYAYLVLMPFCLIYSMQNCCVES